MPRRERNEEVPTDAPSIILPSWFHEAKKYQVMEYDTKKYPFREVIAEWLEVPSDKLEQIHEIKTIPETRTPIHPLIRHAWTAAKLEPKISSTMRRAKKTGLYSSPQYENYIKVYRDFIRNEIRPLCTNGSIDEQIVYQYPPTTRVVMPNGNKTISMHCDKDYDNHQDAEINFWIPVTLVRGNNSLFLESKPGKGDFQSVELQYGQYLKFDGHDCRHYTVHNDTDTCRVSFDFRVIPTGLCTQKQRIGDFCVEETTSDAAYISYWKKSKKNSNPIPCD
ncbi:hypothetical protein CTEN210_17275 [Chaetoceros tenuissimus]|uniref:Uncharacterized protein n=1 Tax=Chaetoceros tenuissimus TaxID=426638 RepID=A0AAD3HF32_9STRA|nr:hypothetical protein CTEN210_17275 [Chaetoceros tenuissimus]